MTFLDEASLEVLKQLRCLMQHSPDNLLLTPPKGYKRGMDIYAMTAMIEVMANVMRLFKKAHGIYPDIVNPKGFNQKIFYRKFFEPILVEKIGNKLNTSFFIPDKLQAVLSCPKVLWRSANNALPENDALPAGYYYLKANHGSNFYRSIQYPLAAQDRLALELECKRWLNSSYGLNTGEWWYNVFKKEIFIEQDVSPNMESISFNFFVAAGNVVYVGMHLKQTNEELYLDSELNPIHDAPVKNKFLNIVQSFKQETIDNLKFYAAEIGAQFSFVRVDFFVDAEEKIYLAELTMSPGNGLSQRPMDFDVRLGALWVLD